jgi:hypothetical protein
MFFCCQKLEHAREYHALCCKKFFGTNNLPEKAVSNSYLKFAGAKEKVEGVIGSSFLPEDWKGRYMEIWDSRSKILKSDH